MSLARSLMTHDRPPIAHAGSAPRSIGGHKLTKSVRPGEPRLYVGFPDPPYGTWLSIPRIRHAHNTVQLA